MARLFWKQVVEGRFPDGRKALNVLFEHRATGETYEWTPKWSELSETTQRAYEVEVANQSDSRFTPLLENARTTAGHERRKQIAKRRLSSQEVESWTNPLQQAWCFERGWHLPHPLTCCTVCSNYPDIHQ